jgi:anti-sigma factor RsiW
MTRTACTESQELLAYWLGELGEADELRLDEHLFACAACSERLQAVVSLSAAIRAEIKRGDLMYVVPTRYLRSLEQAGLRVRQYEVRPGGSVSCTITTDDDLVASTLRAPLAGVRRLDVLI